MNASQLTFVKGFKTGFKTSYISTSFLLLIFQLLLHMLLMLCLFVSPMEKCLCVGKLVNEAPKNLWRLLLMIILVWKFSISLMTVVVILLNASSLIKIKTLIKSIYTFLGRFRRVDSKQNQRRYSLALQSLQTRLYATIRTTRTPFRTFTCKLTRQISL